MNIRPMLPADRAAIVNLLENTPEFNHQDFTVAVEVLDCYLHDPSGSGYHALVAETDSGIAGYVCYGFDSMTVSTWDVYWIAVSRSFQGKGIGRELLTRAENNIRKQNGNLVIIETSSTPDYDRTNRFYGLIGYKEVCRIADYYAPADDKIIYEKRLNK